MVRNTVRKNWRLPQKYRTKKAQIAKEMKRLIRSLFLMGIAISIGAILAFILREEISLILY